MNWFLVCDSCSAIYAKSGKFPSTVSLTRMSFVLTGIFRFHGDCTNLSE
jgi:hypothetical protein